MAVRLITSNGDQDFQKVELVKQEDTYPDHESENFKIKEGAMIYECIGIYSDSHKKRYVIEPKDKTKTKGNSFLLRKKTIIEKFYRI